MRYATAQGRQPHIFGELSPFECTSFGRVITGAPRLAEHTDEVLPVPGSDSAGYS